MAWQQKKEFANNPGFLPPSKLISLQRQSNGFGFTLRHFVVYPPELIRKTTEVSMLHVLYVQHCLFVTTGNKYKNLGFIVPVKRIAAPTYA